MTYPVLPGLVAAECDTTTGLSRRLGLCFIATEAKKLSMSICRTTLRAPAAFAFPGTFPAFPSAFPEFAEPAEPEEEDAAPPPNSAAAPETAAEARLYLGWMACSEGSSVSKCFFQLPMK